MQSNLEVRLEALLFASPGPATIDQLASALEVRPAEIEAALATLEAQYAERGLRIQYHKGSAQMTSAPEFAPEIEKLLQLDSHAHLSRAALEVLAIVSYKQPVTRPEIDSIRGVNSDSSLRTLLRHGLIEETGRTSGPGRPILYATSGEFLQHFGLSSLAELPSIETDISAAASQAEEQVEPETSPSNDRETGDIGKRMPTGSPSSNVPQEEQSGEASSPGESTTTSSDLQVADGQ